MTLQRAFSIGMSATLTLSFVPKSSMVSAELPQGNRALSGMNVNVTMASSWVDNYGTDFYDEIASKYESSYNTAETALGTANAAQFVAFAKYVNDKGEITGFSGDGNSVEENRFCFKNKFVRLTEDIDLPPKS